MTAETMLPLIAASVAAFGLAIVSAVAGFGGGVLLLPVFTALFGLRVAVPMLTLTQLASNSQPREPSFAAVGAASGLGSALLGSVGPLTAPFFLAFGLTRAAYIGTEAASALIMHVTKTVAYAGNGMLTGRIVLYGAALTPATLAGAWVGKVIVGRLNHRVFTLLVEAGLVVAGILYLAGW